LLASWLAWLSAHLVSFTALLVNISYVYASRRGIIWHA
jgi:hypothetical protein